MCGIAGIIDFRHQPSRKLILQMLSQINYRGPDSEGVHESTNVILGIRRLRIIDLNTGDQPIYNEDKNVAVVFNGEIYNYKELKKQLLRQGHKFRTQSDTEVLVHAYEEQGVNFLDTLNGMFAFALWDSKKQQLLLARDHAGIKPLYVYRKSDLLIFGSELKTILLHSEVKKDLNLEGLKLYNTLGYVPGIDSIFKNIYKVPPGSYLLFSRAGCIQKSYWKITPKNDTENLEVLLERSVNLQKIADVPVGILLSGGIDSSLLAYYFLRMMKGKLRSFSVSFSEKSYDEEKFAEFVARYLGFQHNSITLRPQDLLDDFPGIIKKLDEPLADPSFFPTFKVAELARKHVTVALSGDGGDELFGGYPTYQGYLWSELIFRYLPKFILNGLQKITPPDVLLDKNYPLYETWRLFLNGLQYEPKLRHLYWMSQLSGDVNDLLLPHVQEVNLKQILKLIPKLNLDNLNQLLLTDFVTYLQNNLLVKTDRASMYNSLEVRVPFLDPYVINAAFSLDYRKKVSLWQTKIFLRRLGKDKLPRNILQRPKKGFGIPLTDWISGELKPLVSEMLNYQPLLQFFDGNKIKRAWDLQLAGKVNNSKAIWKLTMLSAWMQNYYA